MRNRSDIIIALEGIARNLMMALQRDCLRAAESVNQICKSGLISADEQEKIAALFVDWVMSMRPLADFEKFAAGTDMLRNCADAILHDEGERDIVERHLVKRDVELLISDVENDGG